VVTTLYAGAIPLSTASGYDWDTTGWKQAQVWPSIRAVAAPPCLDTKSHAFSESPGQVHLVMFQDGRAATDMTSFIAPGNTHKSHLCYILVIIGYSVISTIST
jgi:hypothetical protein